LESLIGEEQGGKERGRKERTGGGRGKTEGGGEDRRREGNPTPDTTLLQSDKVVACLFQRNDPKTEQNMYVWITHTHTHTHKERERERERERETHTDTDTGTSMKKHMGNRGGMGWGGLGEQLKVTSLILMSKAKHHGVSLLGKLV